MSKLLTVKDTIYEEKMSKNINDFEDPIHLSMVSVDPILAEAINLLVNQNNADSRPQDQEFVPVDLEPANLDQEFAHVNSEPMPIDQIKYYYDRDGYNSDGYDKDGYDRDGYDRDGYNANDYDRHGYERNSFGLDSEVQYFGNSDNDYIDNYS